MKDKLNTSKSSSKDPGNSSAKDDKALIEENKDLISHLQKLQAEFDNYRKREEASRISLIDRAKESALIEILPVLDNIDRASKSIPVDIQDNAWVKGIEFISLQISQTMNSMGIERFDSIGEIFDPNKHEAIEEVDSEQAAGTIVKEVSAGYKIGDKIVRPASVVVAKNINKE
jgi:molecular chaperone GrpE